MVVQSISFDSTILNWIDSEAKRTGHNLSFMVNFYCSEARNMALKDRPMMLECNLHGDDPVKYSSKLGQCPVCAEEQTKKEIDEKDFYIKNVRSKLIKERDAMQDEISKQTSIINSLDSNDKDFQDKQDKLIKKFDELVERRNKITLELSDLV